MTKNILLITKFNHYLRATNEEFSKEFNIHESRPDKEKIASILKEINIDVILVDLSDFEEVTLHHAEDIFHYAKTRQTPIITIGSTADYHSLNNDSMGQINEMLYQPITIGNISEVLKKYINMTNGNDVLIEINNNGDYRKRILFIDDSGIMLRALKAILNNDYQISMANSAKTALISIARTKPDAILLDYDMPEYDGRQTLEMLRANEKTKNIPVFFLTGVASREKIDAIISLRPQGYILKPLNRKLILETLKEYFSNQNRTIK